MKRNDVILQSFKKSQLWLQRTTIQVEQRTLLQGGRRKDSDELIRIIGSSGPLQAEPTRDAEVVSGTSDGSVSQFELVNLPLNCSIQEMMRTTASVVSICLFLGSAAR